jgi:dTDP-4-dehydrorhamnose 3,5-epimerase-like enzyme
LSSTGAAGACEPALPPYEDARKGPIQVSVDLPGNCRVHPLAINGDERGSLIALEGGRDVPFEVARVYYIFGTGPGIARGFHAHRDLRQLAICVSGSCVITLDDGHRRGEVSLDRPDLAIEIGSMVWREMRDFSEDAVLLVLASAHYDSTDYIHSYEQFVAEVRS